MEGLLLVMVWYGSSSVGVQMAPEVLLCSRNGFSFFGLGFGLDRRGHS